MNTDWKNFLLTQQAQISNDDEVIFQFEPNDLYLHPITHLAVLRMAGADAANFLQGQTTCQVNDVSDNHSCLGALCNPKGKVISTFILLKDADAFLMILPKTLLSSIKERLHKYLLRAKVTLDDQIDDWCLIGLSSFQPESEQPFSLKRTPGSLAISYQQRQLVLVNPDNAQTIWQEHLKAGYKPVSSSLWRYLDICSGLPWLDAATTEQFIPQMLNLDKLGAISFNKGCYTGQEIVARAHYLGQVKRSMFVAYGQRSVPPDTYSDLFDRHDINDQPVGKVLAAQCWQNDCRMLVVLPTAQADSYQLCLAGEHQSEISLSAALS